MKIKFDTLIPNSNIDINIYDSLGNTVSSNNYDTNIVGFYILDLTTVIVPNGDYTAYAMFNNTVVGICDFHVVDGIYYDDTTYNVLNSHHDDGYTLTEALKLQSSVLLGKSQLTGAIINFKSIGDTKTRITATVDGNGNRNSVTLNSN